jgi:hypothetical protein
LNTPPRSYFYSSYERHSQKAVILVNERAGKQSIAILSISTARNAENMFRIAAGNEKNQTVSATSTMHLSWIESIHSIDRSERRIEISPTRHATFHFPLDNYFAGQNTHANARTAQLFSFSTVL